MPALQSSFDDSLFPLPTNQPLLRHIRYLGVSSIVIRPSMSLSIRQHPLHRPSPRGSPHGNSYRLVRQSNKSGMRKRSELARWMLDAIRTVVTLFARATGSSLQRNELQKVSNFRPHKKSEGLPSDLISDDLVICNAGSFAVAARWPALPALYGSNRFHSIEQLKVPLTKSSRY